MFVLDAF
jgi:hypothetical protein